MYRETKRCRRRRRRRFRRRFRRRYRRHQGSTFFFAAYEHNIFGPCLPTKKTVCRALYFHREICFCRQVNFCRQLGSCR